MNMKRCFSLSIIISLAFSVFIAPMRESHAQVVYNWVKIDTEKDIKKDAIADHIDIRNTYSGTTSQDIFIQTAKLKNDKDEWYGGTSTCKCSLAPLSIQAGQTMKLTVAASVADLYGTRSDLKPIKAMSYINSYGIKRPSDVPQGGKVLVSTGTDLTGSQSQSDTATVSVYMPSLKQASVGDKFYVYFLADGSSGGIGQITWTYQLKKQGTSSNTKIPGKTKIVTIQAVKNGINLKWKKLTKNVQGYHIQASTSKKFKTVNISNKQPKSVTSVRLRNIPSKTRVYVRVRAYNKVNGKYKYGAWSAVKSKVVK